MELTQVRSEEPLLQNVQRSRTSCFHWLSVCSFVLLLGTTIILALLHFEVIKTERKVDNELPEVLQIKNYLESVPQTQAMKGKRAAAHLIGKKVHKHIEWQPKSINAFKDGNIKLEKNSLKIEEEGLYFVYTQVVFTGEKCQKNQELSHSVRKKSYSDDESMVILKSSKSVCEVESNSSWTQPIYQGGIFKLEEGDIISTETSNSEFLDTYHGQVYFGILAV
ncbi:tumor necrosis factor-like [Bufo gargarizans]|uniref:tumor necrosis factor-like n=1 Tax=Bufo gargarizans TaxID=30331 RepID=UPI001CF39A85|nr:tumor necrosis factor-like [Bufo gargarizans]